MLLLPAIIIALSGISGAGGLALSVKSIVDSLNASSINRQTQFQNERNLLRFQSVSEKLNSSLESLGKQRMMITRNFSTFVNAFEKLRNRPDFSQVCMVDFPVASFGEIKDVSTVAEVFLGAGVGAIGGSALAAAAASGTTAAVMAFGSASTGTKIAELSGAAARKAALAALGGGALKVGGGGIALGTLVLNVASAGVGLLFEGIAMAYAGSVARKQADKAHWQMLDNEMIITKAVDMQLGIAQSAAAMKRLSVDLCNHYYKPYVMRMRDMVNGKQDYDDYNPEEQALVENTIMTVQLLNYLNNIPLYTVTETNEAGEIETVAANTEAVNDAISHAKDKMKSLRRPYEE